MADDPTAQKNRGKERRIEAIINQAKAYREAGKFAEAEQLLNGALKKFSNPGNQKKLIIELADIYVGYANNFKEKNNYRNAIKYFEKSYQINKVHRIKKSGDDLNNIGYLYHYYFGDKKKALEYHNKSLVIRRKVGDKNGIASSFHNIGAVYASFGKNNMALNFYKQALVLWQEVNNKYGTATTINAMVASHRYLGEIEKALDCLKQALSLHQVLDDKVGKASTLNSMGYMYTELRHWQKAKKYFERALSISQKNAIREQEATVLNNMGLMYSYMGENRKAVFYYEKALPIWQELKDQPGEFLTIHNLGAAYFHLGEKYKALEYHLKALEFWQSRGDRDNEASALHDLGLVYWELGRKQKALKCFQEALVIWREVKSKSSEAVTLLNLMSYWESVNKKRLAIYWGKQSVNQFQELQKRISDPELQEKYFESNKEEYRKLADFLIGYGRLPEARQVMKMLKDTEYFDFIRRDSSTDDPIPNYVDYTAFEARWQKKYNNLIQKFSSISNEYNSLKFRSHRDDEKKRLKRLESELRNAHKAYENFFLQLEDAFEKYEKNKKAMKEDVETLEKRAIELIDTLKYLDDKGAGKNAVLHYLVYGGRISAIISIPNSPSILKQWEINEKDLNATVINYITFILKSGKEIRGVKLLAESSREKGELYKKILNEIIQYQKKLYHITFRPVDEELRTYGITNLTISLDGVLRYIPMGTLWDGESYLIQRYRMSIITPFSLKNIKDEPIKEKNILGFGASQGGQGFAPLSNVRREIRAIVRDKGKGYYGLINGKAFIDNDFKKKIMIGQLKKGNYPLVHIASHFKFSPGDETKNELLLGDGNTMNLNEFRRMGKIFKNVKLLVLSACETGVGGNGEEIDGFGELAQQSGAKSVIASLWPVADESTKNLMVAFYRNLTERNAPSKIEALRQAQLELAGLEDLLQKDKNQADKKHRQKTKYSNPYYWGPFIMMGNWR